MGAFKQLQIMIDSLEFGKKYRVEIYDIDKKDFGQETHECIYVKSTFYGNNQVLSFDDCKTSETFSIDVDHITNIEEIDDEDAKDDGFLKFLCNRFGDKETKIGAYYDIIWKGGICKHLQLSYRYTKDNCLYLAFNQDNGETISIPAVSIGGMTRVDDTEELDIHCKKIDIKVKETQPTWKDDVQKTLGILYHPFILIKQCDEDKINTNSAIFVTKNCDELSFCIRNDSASFIQDPEIRKIKMIQNITIRPEDVIGEHPRYKFFRIESFDPPYRATSYVHPDHIIDYGVKLDVSPVPQPELALGKVYVIKTDGKTHIGILISIMTDYLRFIINDIDGERIAKLVIRAEDIKDTEIYKVDDLSDEE